jgi:hypothetical protein
VIFRETETSYFFMIMSNLAAAKASDDVECLADCIADLEGMALHSKAARIRRNAASEIESASALLATLQAKRFGYARPMIVTINADAPANLN